MNLNLPLHERFKRILLPEMLEPLYERGLSRAEVARELKIDYKFLSRRIGESLALTQAEKRGQTKYIASVLNAEVNQ